MVFKVNPMYKQLTQKVNFCGPTCLQMILFRRNNWLSQELLAKEIGVGIHKKDKDLYLLDFPQFTKNDARIGIALKGFEQEKVNDFLNKFGLKAEVYRPSEIKDINKFVVENIKKGNDIMMNFWLKLFDGRNSGHFVLIADFNSEKEEVTVCDSSSKKKSFWKAPIKKFVDSMSKKYDGDERGFVVFKKI